MTSRHTIRQQYLHVEVSGTESDALTLQNRLTGLCQSWLQPALERAFDHCVPVNENWSIERLDIDAGILDSECLEHDLAELVEQSIIKTLSTRTPSGTVATPTILSGYLERKTTRQNIDQVFVYFLKTGSLPWAFHLPEGKNLEQTVINIWQETTQSTISPDTVLGALALTSARKRLIRQFSPVFLAILLARISPEGKRVMDGILPVLRSFDAPPAAIKQFERQLWETVFAVIGTAGALTEKFIIGETWRNLPDLMAQNPLLVRLLEHHWPGVMQVVSSFLPSTQKAREIPDTSMSFEGQPLADTIASEIQPSEAGEGIYIENAGLVLLHPFLPRFFEGLGIAAEDKLIQPERALCLLHFLTAGQLIAPEYELILPKILCNMPLETPVESDLELTDSEKEEAEALLEAVIGHWDALRNTSIDGLRGAFLLRLGKLSLCDDGDWLLQVESKTLDILLNHLPWGISMIRLPWMQRMLRMEWSH